MLTAWDDKRVLSLYKYEIASSEQANEPASVYVVSVLKYDVFCVLVYYSGHKDPE